MHLQQLVCSPISLRHPIAQSKQNRKNKQELFITKKKQNSMIKNLNLSTHNLSATEFNLLSSKDSTSLIQSFQRIE